MSRNKIEWSPKEGYYKQLKRWLVLAILLYFIFSIFAIILSTYLIEGLRKYTDELPAPSLVIFFCALLFCWGMATIILNFPQMLKFIKKEIRSPFETYERSYLDVEHTYGNNYKVTERKETVAGSGCFFWFSSFGIFMFILWLMFCLYIGSFVNFIKIWRGVKELHRINTEK